MKEQNLEVCKKYETINMTVDENKIQCFKNLNIRTTQHLDIKTYKTQLNADTFLYTKQSAQRMISSHFI